MESNIDIGGETQVKTGDWGRWSQDTSFYIPTIPSPPAPSRISYCPEFRLEEGILDVVVWSVLS